jgi:cytochrome oxidase Cu insertion factor (SCO1/SenC/PrrC family)
LKQWLATITLMVLAAILFDLGGTTSNAAQKSRGSAPARRKSHAVELGGIDQLKEAFQRDAGKVRLVALISPT